jgi:hypothetical protein
VKSIFFLDDWMVEQRVGLERVWGKPRFVKEIFSHFHPRVLGYGGYFSVFFDETVGRYAMYLAVYPPEADPGTFVLRLLSDDPAQWEDPSFELDASPAWTGFEHVVTQEDGDRFWPLVTRTLRGTPLAHLGQYVATLIPSDRSDQNSYLAFSDDGFHFTVDRRHPWHDARSDTWSGIVWNPSAQLFQIYTRPVNVDRRVAVITTPDFRAFSKPVTLLQPDALDPLGTEFYSMPVQQYDDIFIGLLHIFRTDSFEERRYKMGGRMETELSYSYNGFNWYRTPRTPFIPTRDYGLQGGGQVYAMDMLRTQDNRLLIYAHASMGEHAAYPDMQAAGLDTTGYFGPLLYELRLDGFCSLKTLGKDGSLRTKTLIPKDGALSLNLRTAPHTATRVQIVDGETAQPIPGYTFEEAIPISGDHLFAHPRWQDHADLSALVDRPIRIELAMRESELFAIRLNCQVFVGKTPTEQL